MKATGVIVHNRENGGDYGMHVNCADTSIANIAQSLNLSPISDNMPIVIIGPLFAPVTEWTCAMVGCIHHD
jgi:hypothetical protein